MDIHVVQPNETINSIATNYGVSVSYLIQYNELSNPYNLVIGQTIVIAYPQQTYTVKEGDYLEGIAKENGATVMQLLRNNPFLSEREYIYPGETLIISYKTNENIMINGYTFPFIPMDTLKKTLPFLTYISIFNYTATIGGDIITYFDDSDVIEMSKNYGTAPLMLTTTLTAQGEPNPEIAFSIISNEEYQDRHINKILSILKEKGYYGVNMTFGNINSSNINMYNSFITKAANRIKNEGYIFFVTINPTFYSNEEGFRFVEVDYSTIGQVVDSLAFTNFIWGKNNEPPGPISSFTDYQQLLDFTINYVSSDKIRIGIPVIGYDWTLPYVAGSSAANALTLDSALNLARDNDSIIEFDVISQTPYFQYAQKYLDSEVEHIVWFIDARSVNAKLVLYNKYKVSGLGLWNIMVFYAQIWLVINSQYNIVKVIPDNL